MKIYDLSKYAGDREKLKKVCHFAFNVWDCESARAVMDAAAGLTQDVILQTSAGVYKDLAATQFRNYVMDYAALRGITVWLNLDHCKEEALLYDAIDRGWDIVMADGSAMPLEKNIAFVNKISEYARNCGHTLIEAEVGQVKGIEDELVVRDAAVAAREEIRCFVEQTDIDLLAVAFGNAHGEYQTEPKLRYDLVKYAVGISDLPFVVHGGSGLKDEVLQQLITMKGVRKINISTDLKLAYLRGIREAEEEGLLAGSRFQPTKVTGLIHRYMTETASAKMSLLESGKEKIKT